MVSSFPKCEISPASYKRLPRLEEIRAGTVHGIRLFDRVFENFQGRGKTLAEVEDVELCREILTHLHADVEEFPGISMGCYWLWDRALKQEDNKAPVDPSFADIYIMLCAIQRNNFRVVLQIYCRACFAEELYQDLLEKAGFPPEQFRSQPDHWEWIREADGVLEKALEIVLN